MLELAHDLCYRAWREPGLALYVSALMGEIAVKTKGIQKR